MGKKKPRRPRRSFTPEFKAEIVGLCRRGDRSVGQVAKDFELTETAVRDWVKQAGVATRLSSRRRPGDGAPVHRQSAGRPQTSTVPPQTARRIRPRSRCCWSSMHLP
ncbi:transposase [Streptomyces sp. NPDC048430]|uniref:transposase n=1 Tax=Streptomyces sp. NPDC048430 TaxID=3155388 RepID=UPI003434F0D8